MLVKKGPLSQVWLAAHWQKRLTKAHIQECDIDISAERIQKPATPYALRLSGQLLLGLVRIYKCKVQYLHEDACHALSKINTMEKKKANTDLVLPQGHEEANLLHVEPGHLPEDFSLLPDEPILDNLDEILGEEEPISQQQGEDFGLENTLDIELAEIDNLDEPEMGRDDRQQSAELQGLNFEELELPDIDLEEEEGDKSRLSFGSGFSEPSALATASEAPTKASKKRKQEEEEEEKEEMKEEEREEQVDEVQQVEEFAGPLSALEEKKLTEGKAMPPPEPVKKRVEKRRPVKRDAQTELKSKQIQKQLQDASDIMLSDRSMLPLRKRQKLQRDAVQDVLSTIQNPGVGMEALGFGPCVEEAPFAEELLKFLEQGFTTKKLLSLPPREGAWEETEEEEPEEGKEQHQEREDEEVEEVEVGRRGEDQEARLDDVDIPIIDFDEEDAVRPSGGPSDFESLVSGLSDDVMERSVPMAKASVKDAQRLQDMQSFFGEAVSSAPQAEEEEDAKEQQRAMQRTRKTHQVLKNEMKKRNTDSLHFNEWMKERSRTTAAAVFYQLLVLKSHQHINVSQDAPFEDITISKGLRFAKSVSTMAAKV